MMLRIPRLLQFSLCKDQLLALSGHIFIIILSHKIREGYFGLCLMFMARVAKKCPASSTCLLIYTLKRSNKTSRLSDFRSQIQFDLSPLDSSLATFPVADGQLCEAAGCLSPGQAPCQPQSGPGVIFIFNVPH